MTLGEHFQKNVVTYTLGGMAAACFFIGYKLQPIGTKQIINNLSFDGQPTLYERVVSVADLNGNCNGQPDVAEMVDIWQRAGYSLSFNPEHRLVAQRGTEIIVFGNKFEDPQLNNADLEKVLASYK